MERSIPSSIQREPTAVDDAIRAAITEQCIRKEPTAAVGLYSAQTWHEHFERPWVLPNERYLRTSTEVEGGGGHIFCRACVKAKKHGKLLAFKMHVTVEDEDPMKVSKYGIITLECHGCGFEQIVPRKPKIKGMSDDGMMTKDEYGKLGAMMRGGNAPFGNLGRGMGHYDPTQSNVGRAAQQQNEFLEAMQQLRQAGIVDEQRYQEFVRQHLEEARARVAVASPPPRGPFDKPKWPWPV